MLFSMVIALICVWCIVDSWKRNLFLWSVIWSFALVFTIYIWTLL